MTVNVDRVNFSSQWLYFKQDSAGSGSETIPAGGTPPVQTFTISHGLGYNPTTLIFHSIDNTNWYSGYHNYSGVNPDYDLEVTPSTTVDNVVVYLSPIVTGGSPSWADAVTVRVRYKVYIDSGD